MTGRAEASWLAWRVQVDAAHFLDTVSAFRGEQEEMLVAGGAVMTLGSKLGSTRKHAGL